MDETNIVEEQRIDDLESIAAKALEVLAIIALSYKYPIDKDDKEPYVYAQEELEKLGVDLEYLTPHLEQAMRHLGWK
jgi:hypothetical protein